MPHSFFTFCTRKAVARSPAPFFLSPLFPYALERHRLTAPTPHNRLLSHRHLRRNWHRSCRLKYQHLWRPRLPFQGRSPGTHDLFARRRLLRLPRPRLNISEDSMDVSPHSDSSPTKQTFTFSVHLTSYLSFVTKEEWTAPYIILSTDYNVALHAMSWWPETPACV